MSGDTPLIMTPEEKAYGVIRSLSAAWCDSACFSMAGCGCADSIAAAIRESESSARSSALEEAAKIAERYVMTEILEPDKCAASNIAAAIRERAVSPESHGKTR